jgi:pSer/pThr/pTyr-binding forkhead associated (FHA) protein
MQCTQCGMELEAATRFCGYCGADLRPDLRPAAVSQARSSGTVVDVAAQPYLTMVVGPDMNSQIPLTGSMYFGRDTENDVLVNDPRVSRRHARIRVEGTRATIVDVGSTNGTFVNDEILNGEQVLYDSDLVRMGRTEWRFRSTAHATPPPRARRVEVIDEPSYPRPVSASRGVSSAGELVEHDDVPWAAIAVVVGGLFIALTVCCIAAVFIASR